MRKSAGYNMVKIMLTRKVASQLCRGTGIETAPVWRDKQNCRARLEEAFEDYYQHRC
jgi:hypothetical protein